MVGLSNYTIATTTPVWFARDATGGSTKVVSRLIELQYISWMDDKVRDNIAAFEVLVEACRTPTETPMPSGRCHVWLTQTCRISQLPAAQASLPVAQQSISPLQLLSPPLSSYVASMQRHVFNPINLFKG
jgi:hypothetical protein